MAGTEALQVREVRATSNRKILRIDEIRSTQFFLVLLRRKVKVRWTGDTSVERKLFDEDVIPDEIDDKDDGTPDEEDNNCESLMGKEEETTEYAPTKHTNN